MNLILRGGIIQATRRVRVIARSFGVGLGWLWIVQIIEEVI